MTPSASPRVSAINWLAGSPRTLPVIGLLWNPRLLPFFYLLRFMLMMVGIVHTVQFIVKGIRMRASTTRELSVVGALTALVVGVVVDDDGAAVIHAMPARVKFSMGWLRR